MSIPKDPIMLLSYINTQLRDNYTSLEDFLKSNDIEENYIINILGSLNYHYDTNINRFI